MYNIPKQFYYKKNRLHQLRGFYYTVSLGSPSKAASHLNLGNSTITMQINSLERDLNTELFVKERNNFQLTPMGKLLFSLAVPAIQKFDSLYEEFFQKKNQITNSEIDIAAHHIAISYLLPKFIKKFRIEHPKIKIKLKNISPSEALQRLKDETIDAMLYPTLKPPEECYFKSSFSYEPILLMRHDHPLAKYDEESITLEFIAKHNLIRIDPKLIILPLFEDMVNIYNIGSNISFENGNWEMLKHFVKAGLGLALVSTICFEEEDNNILKKISLKKYFPNMNYGFMLKKERYVSEPLRAFIDGIDSNFWR